MKLKNELPSIIIILIPFLYLAYLWDLFPERIPIHWNAKGEIDGYGTKYTLIFTTFILPIFTYLLMLAVPYLDPKLKEQSNSKKYSRIKLILVLITSAIATYIIYSSKTNAVSDPKIVFLIITTLFILLGNYFQTIKHNHFIGIRTGWTLANETVWNKTHRFGGKLWFWGGILLFILIWFLPLEYTFATFMIFTIIISIIPIIYSSRVKVE